MKKVTRNVIVLISELCCLIVSLLYVMEHKSIESGLYLCAAAIFSLTFEVINKE